MTPSGSPLILRQDERGVNLSTMPVLIGAAHGHCDPPCPTIDYPFFFGGGSPLCTSMIVGKSLPSTNMRAITTFGQEQLAVLTGIPCAEPEAERWARGVLPATKMGARETKRESRGTKGNVFNLGEPDFSQFETNPNGAAINFDEFVGALRPVCGRERFGMDR